MKNLADPVKQALSAMAQAELGGGPETSFPSSIWIALGVGQQLPGHVMTYAIATCRRMHAGLLLLCVDAENARALLADFLPEMRDIELHTEQLPDASTATVAHALDQHHGLQFAITGAEDDPLRPLLRARRGARSPVPLVLVSAKTPRGATSH